MTSRKKHEGAELFNRRAAVAASVFSGLVFLVFAFQFALAAGAPWGHLTMGGAFPGRLPPTMRVAAFVQALLLLLFGAIVVVRARLMLPRWHAISRKLVWLVVAYTVVGTLLNAITPSPWERALWLPVVVILGVSAVVVARTPQKCLRLHGSFARRLCNDLAKPLAYAGRTTVGWGMRQERS